LPLLRNRISGEFKDTGSVLPERLEDSFVEICSPKENMERDSSMLFDLEEGRGGPSFRLYRWDRLCLSIGLNQKNIPSCKIPVVRRPTGGGALLHGWDLSFALVDFREKWGRSPKEIYRKVAGFLIEAFSRHGVDLKMERFKGNYLGSEYCFWVPTFGELTFRGRKAVSMAMRTLRKSFLIHGSIYISFDYQKASRVLNMNADLMKERIVSAEDIGIGENLLEEILLKLAEVNQEGSY